MITDKELLNAWITIGEYCKQQTQCVKCCMFPKCDRYFERPLRIEVLEFINDIGEK